MASEHVVIACLGFLATHYLILVSIFLKFYSYEIILEFQSLARCNAMKSFNIQILSFNDYILLNSFPSHLSTFSSLGLPYIFNIEKQGSGHNYFSQFRAISLQSNSQNYFLHST